MFSEQRTSSTYILRNWWTWKLTFNSTPFSTNIRGVRLSLTHPPKSWSSLRTGFERRSFHLFNFSRLGATTFEFDSSWFVATWKFLVRKASEVASLSQLFINSTHFLLLPVCASRQVHAFLGREKLWIDQPTNYLVDPFLFDAAVLWLWRMISTASDSFCVNFLK